MGLGEEDRSEKGQSMTETEESIFNQTAAFTELQWCGPIGPVQQAAVKGQSVA